jgi:hypothetical protein
VLYSRALKSPCRCVAVLPHQPTCHLSSAKPSQQQVGTASCNREIEARAVLFQMQLRIAQGRAVDAFDAERAAFEPALLQFKIFAWLKVSLVRRLVGRIAAPSCANRSRYRRAYLIPRHGPKRHAESWLCRNSLLEKDLRGIQRSCSSRFSLHPHTWQVITRG